MICSILQPTFFPWSGYFNIIAKSNKVIFLDDAQFSKNSWHNRNLILSNNKKKWITIPLKKSSINTSISSKRTDSSKDWKSKIINNINQNYSQCKFYSNLSDLLNYFSMIEDNQLSEINIKIIKFICDKLNIQTEFILSSKFKIKALRTEKIIKILNNINATKYLSPIGSKDYLLKDDFKNKTKIDLEFNNFTCKSYHQKNSKEFIDYLSIIDLIGNVGWTDASTYVKK